MITYNTEQITIEKKRQQEWQVFLRYESKDLGVFSCQRLRDGCAVGYFLQATHDQALEAILNLALVWLYEKQASFIDVKNCPYVIPFAHNHRITLDSIERYSLTLPLVEIAAVVMENDAGQVLLGLRPEGLIMPGLWEFPGGKLEDGEDAMAAGIREINEELGVEIIQAESLLEFSYCFTKNRLKGTVLHTKNWRGVLGSLHHRELRWVDRSDLALYAMPLSNVLCDSFNALKGHPLLHKVPLQN